MRKTVKGILSKFDKMIADLEEAVAKNNEQIDKNAEEIRLILAEQESLSRENDQGQMAIRKLRELTGQN
jgi:uncharacterized protein (DUF3084 family)